MTERESDAQVHDSKQPPRLQALDVSAFGGSTDPVDLVCDVDDPDCVEPSSGTVTDSRDGQAGAARRTEAPAED